MALTLSIGITENSYSVANNTSSVTVSVNISWTGGSWDHNYYTKYVTINGSQYNFDSVKVNPNRTTRGSQTLYSTTVTIGHNSDGSGSVSCYSSVKTATGSGTVTASNSKTLTTIPRTSNISISASSVNMGSAITVYTNRKSTSFTHYLYYSIGNGWQRITTGIGDSYSWTVPLSLASSIPSATSRSVSLLLETYSGSTFIGSTSTSFTANVPSSVVPSVSGISVVDNNGYVSEFGGYVQSKSVPKITVNASASYSSISQYKVTFQNNTYISSSNVITLGAISQTGSLNITVTATDARGRTASKTVSITGLAYSAPSLSVSAIRCDSDGTANDEGAYMKVSCKAEISPIDNKNSKAVTLKYKKKTVKDWTTQKTWAVYSVNENTVIAADIDSSYDIQLTAEDYFTSANQNSELGTVAVIIDFNASGKGMAIGKVSEGNEFEVDWNSRFKKKIYLKDIVYVGRDSIDSTGSAPSTNEYTQSIAFTDKNGKVIGYIQASHRTSGNIRMTMATSRSVNGANKTSGIWMDVDASGNPVYGMTSPSKFLEALGVKDYIVEQGTSGIWTYRKWNSGIAECWGRQDDLKITNGYTMFNSFPSGLFIDDRPEVVNANAWYGIDNNRQARKLHITAERGNFVYLRNYDGSLPTGTFAIMVDAKGRWK